MNSIKNNIIPILIVLVVSVLLYLALSSNSEYQEEQIKKLKKENELLSKKNDSIFLVINGFKQLMLESDLKIRGLEQTEAYHESKVDALDEKLKQLKKKYEQANNHSANFGSADIKRYFADSLNF